MNIPLRKSGASLDSSKARLEQLRIVPLAGPAMVWNVLIQKAFSDGANAVLLLGEGVAPADGALAALREVRSTNRTANPPQPADWLSSAALLIPDAAWRAIGGFDPRFGSYLADVDWCLRARDAGFQCLNVHDARFASSRTSEAFDIHTESIRWRSTLVLARKHSVPYGLLTLAFRQILAQMSAELDRVDF
jgi:GT2 family glycosyltransferase